MKEDLVLIEDFCFIKSKLFNIECKLGSFGFGITSEDILE